MSLTLKFAYASTILAFKDNIMYIKFKNSFVYIINVGCKS